MKAVRLLLVVGTAVAAVLTTAPAASAKPVLPDPNVPCFIVNYPDGSHDWVCL